MTDLDVEIAIDAMLEERPRGQQEFVSRMRAETVHSHETALWVAETVHRLALLGIRTPLDVLVSPFVIELLAAYERAANEISRARRRHLK